MTGRGHYIISAGVILAVVLNTLLAVYNAGRLTQAVQDLTGRVTRLEQTIDNWRRGGAVVPLPENYGRAPEEGG